MVINHKNTDKRTEGHMAIVITVYNHYVNITILPHTLLDPPPPISLSKKDESLVQITSHEANSQQFTKITK